MEREVIVYMDFPAGPALVGRLWSRRRKGRESATFEYERSWLAHPDRFALEPALMLAPGPYHTGVDRPMFGAIGDSAPDRWGRVLMRRAERRAAEREKRTPRTLFEIDFLLLVDDEARAGALRFAEEALVVRDDALCRMKQAIEFDERRYAERTRFGKKGAALARPCHGG